MLGLGPGPGQLTLALDGDPIELGDPLPGEAEHTRVGPHPRPEGAERGEDGVGRLVSAVKTQGQRRRRRDVGPQDHGGGRTTPAQRLVVGWLRPRLRHAEARHDL